MDKKKIKEWGVVALFAWVNASLGLMLMHAQSGGTFWSRVIVTSACLVGLLFLGAAVPTLQQGWEQALRAWDSWRKRSDEQFDALARVAEDAQMKLSVLQQLLKARGINLNLDALVDPSLATYRVVLRSGGTIRTLTQEFPSLEEAHAYVRTLRLPAGTGAAITAVAQFSSAPYYQVRTYTENTGTVHARHFDTFEAADAFGHAWTEEAGEFTVDVEYEVLYVRPGEEPEVVDEEVPRGP